MRLLQASEGHSRFGAYLGAGARDCVEIVRALWVTRMCTSAIGVIYGSGRSVSLTWAHHKRLTVAPTAVGYKRLIWRRTFVLLSLLVLVFLKPA